MNSNTQHDQQEWLPVATYETEDEAQAAAAALSEAGIGSMIDRRMTAGRYALLVATLEQDAAAMALDIAPAIGDDDSDAF